MILFMASMFLPILLPFKDEALLVRIVLNICNLGVVILMIMIYFNERVFWFNGITYEEALLAGSDRRKSYAKKHLFVFFLAFIIYFLLSIIFQIFNVSMWVDIVLYTILLIGAALGTIKIKL